MSSSVLQAALRGDAVCAQPPTGMDMTTLSSTQLAYYGLQHDPLIRNGSRAGART